MKKIIIAIDGYSSCGKSTLAKGLAKLMNYAYIDTGAMYRCVALYALQNKLDDNTLIKNLDDVHISFQFNKEKGHSEIFLNGENVEDEIRKLYVSEKVSEISTLKPVREKLVEMQKKYGDDKGIVMDGRDIGTVVFPQAELKIFMTADPDIRAKRRFEELISKGQTTTLEEVKENLKKRDFIDSTRAESPLKKSDDAVVLDNSNLSMKEQLNIAYEWAEKKLTEL